MADANHKRTAEQISTDLSAARTELSFQRTRLSSDRTLMSVIRTSLALISFGFTIHTVFQRLAESQALSGWHGARNFSVALVALGIVMLVTGIVYEVTFMRGMRKSRDNLKSEGLGYPVSIFPMSLPFFIAVALLAIGIAVIVSMLFRIGPFV